MQNEAVSGPRDFNVFRDGECSGGNKPAILLEKAGEDQNSSRTDC